MPYHQNLNPSTQTAGGAVRNRRLVKESGGKLVEGGAGADEIVAVSLEAAAADGDTFACQNIDGNAVVEVEAGAAVAAGAPIASDAQGRAVTAASGHKVCGYARSDSSASAAGEIISVQATRLADIA